MKAPKNATHMTVGVNPTYFKKVDYCNLYQPYSKNTGRLLQRFEIYDSGSDKIKETK